MRLFAMERAVTDESLQIRSLPPVESQQVIYDGEKQKQAASGLSRFIPTKKRSVVAFLGVAAIVAGAVATTRKSITIDNLRSLTCNVWVL